LFRLIEEKADIKVVFGIEKKKQQNRGGKKIMGKTADYITRIEIKALWAGHRHIVWNLRPDVNILSGVNGVGKSTILRKSVAILHQYGDTLGHELSADKSLPGVQIDFSPKDADCVRFDDIHSFDRPLLHADLLEKLADGRVATELDFQIYQLQRKYLDYQVNLGNRMIALLTQQDPSAKDAAVEVMRMKGVFQDMVDDLFKETGKRMVRESNEILFEQDGETLTPYKLSSGEKQMMVILLTVLVEDCQPYVLFMDEPEASLHIDWQQRLIGLIRTLNPKVQIVLTTHSPAVIMNGWMDAVTEVSDIVTEQ
jgi:ABC-type cobalamin/Fe3+-siderophores transport system ATPase subunit